PQLAELGLGLAERFLRQVFRVGGRSRQPVGVAVQARVVVVDELLDGALLAGQPHDGFLTFRNRTDVFYSRDIGEKSFAYSPSSPIRFAPADLRNLRAALQYAGHWRLAIVKQPGLFGKQRREPRMRLPIRPRKNRE